MLNTYTCSGHWNVLSVWAWFHGSGYDRFRRVCRRRTHNRQPSQINICKEIAKLPESLPVISERPKGTSKSVLRHFTSMSYSVVLRTYDRKTMPFQSHRKYLTICYTWFRVTITRNNRTQRHQVKHPGRNDCFPKNVYWRGSVIQVKEFTIMACHLHSWKSA